MEGEEKTDGEILIAIPIGRHIPKKATPILHFLSPQIVPTFFISIFSLKICFYVSFFSVRLCVG